MGKSLSGNRKARLSDPSRVPESSKRTKESLTSDNVTSTVSVAFRRRLFRKDTGISGCRILIAAAVTPELRRFPKGSAYNRRDTNEEDFAGCDGSRHFGLGCPCFRC